MSIHPEGPKLTIYSKKLEEKQEENVAIKAENTQAKAITQNGRVISSGKETERLGMDILGDTETYQFAIQTLTTAQQAQAATKGLSWFQSLRWIPLKVGDTTVLLNIRSATKRLKKLGVGDDEIKEFLANSQIEDRSKQFFNMIKNRKIEILTYQLPGKEQFIREQADTIFTWMDQGYSFQDVKSIMHHHISIKIENIDVTKVAFQFFREQEDLSNFKNIYDFARENTLIDEKMDEPTLKANLLLAKQLYQFTKEVRLDKQQQNRWVQLAKDGIPFDDIREMYEFSKEEDLSIDQVEVIYYYQKAFGSEFKNIYDFARENTLIDEKMDGPTPKANLLLAKQLYQFTKEVRLDKQQQNRWVQLAKDGIPFDDIREMYEFSKEEDLSIDQVEVIYYYQKAFGSESLDIAYRAIQHLQRRQLNEIEIQKIVSAVKAHPEWLVPEIRKGSTILYAKDYPGKLPRSLQINPDGTIYVLFNKVKKGDRSLGEGGTKKVWAAMELQSAEMAAHITMTPTDEFAFGYAANELKLSLELSGHPGIAHTYAMTSVIYEKGGIPTFGYMQQLYTGGDLADALAKGVLEGLSEEERLFLTHRLLSAGKWLNFDKGLIHRDFKPENVFLIRDHASGKIIDIVIGDFDAVCKRTSQSDRAALQGTPAYMSPEVVRAFTKDLKKGTLNQVPNETSRATTVKGDSWAMGLILFQIHRKSIEGWENIVPPSFSVDADDPVQLIQKIADAWEANPDWLPQPPDKQSLAYMIWSMLRTDPEDRFTSEDALDLMERVMKDQGLGIAFNK